MVLSRTEFLLDNFHDSQLLYSISMDKNNAQCVFGQNDDINIHRSVGDSKRDFESLESLHLLRQASC